ncbi:hypothetical protein [Rhizobium wuzhouense]|uniref:Thiolase C-terminal domain-containing protein n=1 Tax=Rhizobium wuzhouense TaxID=1986026 RepID=A0ABX5NP52_9HYPH|nr:hypothetical protein [Rhizobium wuzhouense]PYB72296.1 hypothetical protein DMY87_14195 [Rhizobium wuzhouense]
MTGAFIQRPYRAVDSRPKTGDIVAHDDRATREQQHAFAVHSQDNALASQGLATLRRFGPADDDPPVSPNGGAIAPDDRLGMRGARISATAPAKMGLSGDVSALATVFIGVCQGIQIARESA